MAREEPVLMIGEKVKATMREFRQKNARQASIPVSLGRTHELTHSLQPNKGEFFVLKKDLLDDVMAKAVPEDVLTRV